ncbi:MAG: hypothetical protein M3Z31_10440 [Pseudomonadota bacterium]|nr:hypothetical protein [Pseudomonadota bacterium]
MTTDNEHGEGNYKASRDYNERTKRFVDSGKVDEAAQDAAPHSAEEAAEMEAAEEIGRQHAKEEDPAVRKSPDSGKPKP